MLHRFPTGTQLQALHGSQCPNFLGQLDTDTRPLPLPGEPWSQPVTLDKVITSSGLGFLFCETRSSHPRRPCAPRVCQDSHS